MRHPSQKSNIVTFKKKRMPPVGILIFAFIFIYVLINIYIFMTKEHLSSYEVHAASLALDTNALAVIVREEQLVPVIGSGYINYYYREGSRIAKGSKVYSVGEATNTYAILDDSNGKKLLSELDWMDLKSTVLEFHRKFDQNQFCQVNDFYSILESTANQMINHNKLEQIQQMALEAGLSEGFQMVQSEASGIVSYNKDTLTGLTLNNVDSKIFELTEEEFERTSLQSSEPLKSGSIVYRLVPNEAWNLIAMITPEQYVLLRDRTEIKIKIQKDGLVIKTPLMIERKGENYYAVMSMDRYMVRYINDRFLDLEFLSTEDEMLKIPLSAITEKEFYLIPVDYFSQEEGFSRQGLTKEIYDEKSGEASNEFVETDIYFQDETNAYVDVKLFEPGTYITNKATGERYRISALGKLEGVFNINKGYSIFRRIERAEENGEYCTIKKGTTNGVELYDHIALNAATVIESAIIP